MDRFGGAESSAFLEKKTAHSKGNDVFRVKYFVKVRKLIVVFQKNVDNHLRISRKFFY